MDQILMGLWVVLGSCPKAGLGPTQSGGCLDIQPIFICRWQRFRTFIQPVSYRSLSLAFLASFTRDAIKAAVFYSIGFRQVDGDLSKSFYVGAAVRKSEFKACTQNGGSWVMEQMSSTSLLVMLKEPSINARITITIAITMPRDTIFLCPVYFWIPLE